MGTTPYVTILMDEYYTEKANPNRDSGGEHAGLACMKKTLYLGSRMLHYLRAMPNQGQQHLSRVPGSPNKVTGRSTFFVYNVTTVSFSDVAFVLLCFVFVFLLSLKPRPFVQSFFGVHAPRQPPAVFT